MISSLLSQTSLNDFKLEASNISELNERTILIKKWNWDYELAHKFQRHCLTVLDKNPSIRLVICCSHPRVFTHGRGLQKAKKGEKLELVDFDKSLSGSLPYPYFQIERGGGLTFHHPGQMIIYPILRLNPKTLSLSSLVDTLLDTAIEILQEWGINNLSHTNQLLGLWHGERKLASMGIAIEKLTTFHGMALNFYQDDDMKKALMVLNPCGLKAEIYTSVEEIMNLQDKNLEVFSDTFLRRISHAWK